MPEKITTEQVLSAVRSFWQAFESKSADALAEFYAHEGTVFGSESPRPEPARLATARRQREYFHSHSTVKATPGEIEVIPIGEHAAIAIYNFKFHANKLSSIMGKALEETIEGGRATQVFGLNPQGELKIFHEHLSVPAK